MSNQAKISRREFIKDATVGAAAVAGAGAFGTLGSMTASAQTQCPSTVPTKWDYEADVVIVGYGGAGAVTGITAHDAGAKVLILEKLPADTPTEIRHTCNTRMSNGSGGLWVGSADDAFKFIKWGTVGTVPDDVIKAYVQKWIDLDKWVKSMGGTTYLSTRGLANMPKDAPGFNGSENWKTIMYAPTTTDSAAVGWRLYEDNINKRGIQVLFETPGKRLIADPVTGEVLGVEAAAAGKVVYVKARRAVVLACGGFEENEQLKKEAYRGVRIECMGHPGNTGDGIDMAAAVGADLWHMPCAAATGLFLRFPGTSNAQSISVPLSGRGSFAVDQYGKRFWNEETMASGKTSWFKFAEPDGTNGEYPRIPTWIIFDQAGLQIGPLVTSGNGKGQLRNGTAQPWPDWKWSKDNSAEIAKGWILKGDTIDDLALKIKQDSENKSFRVPNGRMTPEILKETLRKYNQYSASGADPEFGRSKATLIPLATPPYYAIKTYPGGPNTWGGPRRNGKCQVLRLNNTVIGRLYSAGELGSINNLQYPVNNFWECVISGRIAGENAAAEKPVV